MRLDFRRGLDLQLPSQGCQVTQTPTHSGQTELIAVSLRWIDGASQMRLIGAFCPAANGPVPSAIYIPRFEPPTSHSSVESPSLSCSSISLLKSSSSGPSSLSSLFFLQFPLSSAKLQHQTLQSSVSDCCVLVFFFFFYFFLLYLKVRSGRSYEANGSSRLLPSLELLFSIICCAEDGESPASLSDPATSPSFQSC